MKFKIGILGEPEVGKTTLLHRYITGEFKNKIQMTIGVDFKEKHLKINGYKIILQIWDFGGFFIRKPEFRMFLKNADGVFFMFDITNKSSLDNIDEWLDLLRVEPSGKSYRIPLFVIGGKSDLEEKRSILSETALELTKQKNIPNYFECSSLTGNNIDNIFTTLIRDILNI